MKREIPIISPEYNFSDKDKAIISGNIAEEMEDFENTFPGEVEKTEQHIEMISYALKKVGLLFDHLGLDSKLDIPISRFHFITPSPDVNYSKTFMEDNVSGSYNVEFDQILIKLDPNISEFETLSTILHELLHFVSHRKDQVYKELNGKPNVREYRVGYRIANLFNEEPHEHFRGLNEFMVRWIEYYLLDNGQNEISDKFKIPTEQLQSTNKNNLKHLEILIDIVSGIEQATGLSSTEIYEQLEKGLFTGELIQLRIIEKSFGKDALKVLSLYESLSPKVDADQKEVDILIRKFFDPSTEEAERIKLKDTIFEMAGQPL